MAPDPVATTALLFDWIIRRCGADFLTFTDYTTRNVAQMMVTQVSNCSAHGSGSSSEQILLETLAGSDSSSGSEQDSLETLAGSDSGSSSAKSLLENLAGSGNSIEQSLVENLAGIAKLLSNDPAWTIGLCKILAQDIVKGVKIVAFDPSYTGAEMALQTVAARVLALEVRPPDSIYWLSNSPQFGDAALVTYPNLQQQTVNFLDMEPEVRNRIYEEIFAPSDHALEITVGRTSTYIQLAPDEVLPTISRTCKQIRNETLPMFYGNTTFSFTLDSPSNLVQAKKWLQQIPTAYSRFLTKVQIYVVKPKNALGPVSIKWRKELDRENQASIESVMRACATFVAVEDIMTPIEENVDPVAHFTALLDYAMEEYVWN